MTRRVGQLCPTNEPAGGHVNFVGSSKLERAHLKLAVTDFVARVLRKIPDTKANCFAAAAVLALPPSHLSSVIKT